MKLSIALNKEMASGRMANMCMLW